MNEKLIAYCFCVAVVAFAVTIAMITATAQMKACESMCGSVGVRKFSLHQRGLDSEVPACECAR